MTPSKSSAARSAVISWLKAEPRPPAATTDDPAEPTPQRRESPEQVGLAVLAAGSILGGLLLSLTVGPAGWLLVGFGALCLISYLVVGALRR